METLTDHVEALIQRTRSELGAINVHMGLQHPVAARTLVVASWETAGDILAFLDALEAPIAGLLLLGEPIGASTRLPSLHLYHVLAQGHWESAWQRQEPSQCAMDVHHHADLAAVATSWSATHRSVQELFVHVPDREVKLPRHVWPLRFMYYHGLCLLTLVAALRDLHEGAAKLFTPTLLKTHLQDVPMTVTKLLWPELERHRVVLEVYMHVMHGTGPLHALPLHSPVLKARLNDAHPDLQDRSFFRQAVRDVFLTCRDAVHGHACAACLQPHAALRCKQCRGAWYCDVACQRSHWTAHRFGCKEM